MAEYIAQAVGDDRESAALLAVTAWRESDFLEVVEDCRRTGDGDRAISSYQLHWRHWAGRSREQVCADPRLAARLAYASLAARDEGDTPTRRIARFAGRPEHDREVVLRAKAVAIALGD
jgi:hypothetical protein